MYSYFNFIFIIYRPYINNNRILNMSGYESAEKFDGGADPTFADDPI